jgi:hypothetical protein
VHKCRYTSKSSKCKVDRRPSSGSRNYFRDHAKLYMRMPFEGDLPIFTIIPTLHVLLSIRMVSKGCMRLSLSAPDALDGKRIHPPSPSQPRSRDFSPVEFDGLVVDPDGRTWEAGRMFDEHSESSRTFYFARKLRPAIFCRGEGGKMSACSLCGSGEGSQDLPEDRDIPVTPASPANLSTRPHTATLTLTLTS